MTITRRALLTLIPTLAVGCALRSTHRPRGNATITGNVFRRRWSTLRFGKVRSSGMAVAHLPVRLYYDGKVVDKVFTSYQGYFEFKNVGAGEYLVTPLQGDSKLVKVEDGVIRHVGLFQR